SNIRINQRWRHVMITSPKLWAVLDFDDYARSIAIKPEEVLVTVQRAGRCLRVLRVDTVQYSVRAFQHLMRTIAKNAPSHFVELLLPERTVHRRLLPLIHVWKYLPMLPSLKRV